jgi:hypothetical protein
VSGVTVTYPAAWFAYAGDATWKCLLFDPDPITVPPDSELPEVAVAVLPIPERTFAQAVSEYEDARYWTIVRSGDTTVDGKPARAYELDTTGEGFYPKGIREYVIVVDRGERGYLVIETVGQPGADFEANVTIVDLMAGAIVID